MRAPVLEEYNKLTYMDMPEPEIEDNEVLEVMACGIYGSDVNGMDGSSGRPHTSLTMSHEASEVIVKNELSETEYTLKNS